MPRQSEQTLLEFIRTELLHDDRAALDPTTPLFEAGLINSINILALIGYVEGRIGRRLEDDEILMPNFRTAESIASRFFRHE